MAVSATTTTTTAAEVAAAAKLDRYTTFAGSTLGPALAGVEATGRSLATERAD
jgi:hypothetical protein